MGRLLHALALLISLAVTGVGIAGAAYVGSDDRVWLDPAGVDSEPGQLVVTSADLTSYRDLDLLVRASAPGGVFLGVGNPVDVADLAAQVDHYEITGVRRTRVLGGQRVARAEEPVALQRPSSLPDWYDQREGEGWQELLLELDGTPIQLYVQPRAEDVAPDLQLGIRLEGLFAAFLGLAAVGAMLLALTTWRIVRARRQRRPSAGPGSGSAAGSRSRPTAAVAQPGAPLRMSLVVVGALATGCAWIPEEVDATPAKVALEPADLPAVVASIDRRIDRARKDANPPSYDTLAWRAVDTGPQYDDDLYRTRLAAGLDSGPVERLTHEPLTVLSPVFDSYPMWSVALTDSSGGERRTTDKQTAAERKEARRERRRVTLYVYERASAARPWMRRLQATLDPDDVPTAASEPQAPDSGDRKAARRAIDATLAYLRGGEADGVEVDTLAKEFRRERIDVLRKGKKFWSAITLESMPLADPADSLRMVAAEGGQLAVGVRKLRYVWKARPAYSSMRWTDGYASVNGGSRGELVQELNVVVVIWVPDDGSTPRVLSTYRLRDLS